MTREQLSRAAANAPGLRSTTVKYLMSAWGVLLRPAAYQGFLAFGESIGPRVTFVRPYRRSIPKKEPSVDESFRELFLRFLKAYGPAKVSDFAHWWGGLHEEEKSMLERDMGDLMEVDMNGHMGMMIKSDAEEARGIAPFHGVRLLPSFDCYAMFYSPREQFVPVAHRDRIFRKVAGWNAPAVVIDGTAAGTWNLKRKGRKVEVELEPFRPLTPREKKGANEEAARLAEFLSAPTNLTVNT